MFFPAVDARPDIARPDIARPGPVMRRWPAPCGVTVLVVEDDTEVLDLVEIALRDEGHTVITATDGRKALAALERHPEVVALVSDVVMPNGLSGVTLGHEARRRRPDLAVLLMSGYPRDELNGGAGMEGFAFLSKPFRPAELAARVQDMLTETA